MQFFHLLATFVFSLLAPSSWFIPTVKLPPDNIHYLINDYFWIAAFSSAEFSECLMQFNENGPYDIVRDQHITAYQGELCRNAIRSACEDLGYW